MDRTVQTVRKYKSIALSPANYMRLQNRGRKGETFDEIMTKLLDIGERNK